jgi:hypothetical protein
MNSWIALTRVGSKKGGDMTTARAKMICDIGRHPYGHLLDFVIAAHGPAPPPH